MQKRFLSLLAIFLLTSPLLYSEASDLEILQRLDSHLNAIRAEYEFGRILGGSLVIGTGALFAGLGYVIDLETSGYMYWSDMISIMYYVMGGGFGVIGLIVLALPSDYESLPKEFRSVPETSPDEIKAKIAKGEGYLASLADKSRSGRFLSAGIIGSLGIGMLVMYYSSGMNSMYSYDYYSSVYLYEGIFLAGSALITFIVKSKAENEHESYVDWKSGKGIAARSLGNKPIFELSAIPGGIEIVLRY